MKVLVIVESVGKIKKIQKILNSRNEKTEYVVEASLGHCRDLLKDSLSIDIENNYEPTYFVTNNKVVTKLKKLAKECDRVVLAADEDREGEMIAESLRILLKLKDPDRIVFHEITEKAINHAIDNPRKIDYNIVDSQKARRILDRLLGFKLTELLWKNVAGKISTGRVQSVIINIIAKKEEEIAKAISEPYFKTIASLNHNDIDFNSTLMKKNKVFMFENKELAMNFLQSLNKKDEFKVINIDKSESVRNPPPPFTTSTMQRDALSKLRMSLSAISAAAKVLYEKSYITYIRTDSINISSTCVNECKNFIIKKWGDKYSSPKSYKNKNKNAQEAHECIRPTNMSVESCDKLDSNCQRLYKLIRDRTLASQMSSAVIDIKTVHIDIPNKLPKKTYFQSKFENIKFDGFLILYNNMEESENNKGKIKIKVGDNVMFKKIEVKEEYSRLPARYTQGSLIEFLEKNGIGRPSTYESNFTKVLKNNYIEIKSIEGEKRNSIQLTLSNKFKITDKIKEVVVGKEKNKLVPTKLGLDILTFLREYFDEVVNVKYTSELENHLDMIVNKKATWFNIVDMFYGNVRENIEKLEKIKVNKFESNDTVFGKLKDGREVYKGSGKAGPYLKIKDGKKWKYSSITEGEKIDMDNLESRFTYPLNLGKHNRKQVVLKKGEYGLYVNYDKKNYKLPPEMLSKEITLDVVIPLLDVDPFAIKSFDINNKKVNVRKGPYGYYIQYHNGRKKVNKGLPNNVDIENLKVDDIISLL